MLIASPDGRKKGGSWPRPWPLNRVGDPKDRPPSCFWRRTGFVHHGCVVTSSTAARRPGNVVSWRNGGLAGPALMRFLHSQLLKLHSKGDQNMTKAGTSSGLGSIRFPSRHPSRVVVSVAGRVIAEHATPSLSGRRLITFNRFQATTLISRSELVGSRSLLPR